MADKRIQDLVTGTGLKGTDLTPIAKDNLDTTYTTSKYTVDDIKTYVQSDLATVATTGSYNDLIDLPIIPTVPTNVSAFTNDAGYLINTDLSTVAFSGDYNDLINTPVIPGDTNIGNTNLEVTPGQNRTLKLGSASGNDYFSFLNTNNVDLFRISNGGSLSSRYTFANGDIQDTFVDFRGLTCHTRTTVGFWARSTEFKNINPLSDGVSTNFGLFGSATATSYAFWSIGTSANINTNNGVALFPTGNISIGTYSQSDAKLRIVNTLAQPSLIVEDSTTPDITSFVIDENGNVSIGAAKTYLTTYKLDVFGTINTTGFRMNAGSGVGKIFTSDAAGLASWSSLKTINGTSLLGTGNIAITVPTNVSAFTNDAGYLTSVDLATVAFSGDYNDLINTPTPITQVWRQSTGTGSIENTLGNINIKDNSLAFNTTLGTIYDDDGIGNVILGSSISLFGGSADNFILGTGLNTNNLQSSYIFGSGHNGGEINSNNTAIRVFSDNNIIGSGNTGLFVAAPSVIGNNTGNVATIGGNGNTISNGLNNTVVVGGTGIVATESDTVYTPQLIPTSFRLTTGAGNGKVATSDAAGNLSWQPVPFEASTLTTGVAIDFTTKKIYNSFTSPGTGNITGSLTGAQYGISQKMYHLSATEPTIPATWKLLGDGVYVPNEVNIIFFEWAGGTRVEYWIVQEQ